MVPTVRNGRARWISEGLRGCGGAVQATAGAHQLRCCVLESVRGALAVQVNEA